MLDFSKTSFEKVKIFYIFAVVFSNNNMLENNALDNKTPLFEKKD